MLLGRQVLLRISAKSYLKFYDGASLEFPRKAEMNRSKWSPMGPLDSEALCYQRTRLFLTTEKIGIAGIKKRMRHAGKYLAPRVDSSPLMISFPLSAGNTSDCQWYRQTSLGSSLFPLEGSFLVSSLAIMLHGSLSFLLILWSHLSLFVFWGLPFHFPLSVTWVYFHFIF